MTEYVDSWSTARKRHRCELCWRFIEPGESYWRQAGLDRGAAWTNKTCEHCERVVWAYGRSHEWEPECGCRIEFRHLRCGPCDENRIATLNRQGECQARTPCKEDVSRAFEAATP